MYAINKANKKTRKQWSEFNHIENFDFVLNSPISLIPFKSINPGSFVVFSSSIFRLENKLRF